MSRIQDALRQAEAQRSGDGRRPTGRQTGGMSAEVLNDEIRHLEISLASRRPQPETPAAPAPAAAANRATPAQDADRLGEEIRRCQAELAAHETCVSRSRQQRASFQVQVAEQERVVAQAEVCLSDLRQRLDEADAAMRRTETERAAHAERLEALRHCQALALAAAEAERDIQAHSNTIARISRVQQRVNERLSKQQSYVQQLQQTAEQLRRQLNAAELQAQATDRSRAAHGDARS